MTRGSKPVTQNDFRRARLTCCCPKRGHRVQVDQQRHAPFVTDTAQFFRQELVIRAVYSFDPPVQVARREWLTPNLTETRQSTRDKTKAALSPPARLRTSSHSQTCVRHHFPVNVIMCAIEIKHRARCVGHEQSSARLPSNFDRQFIDVSVLQSQTAQIFVAHLGQNAVRIGSSRMRNRNQDRHRQGMR